MSPTDFCPACLHARRRCGVTRIILALTASPCDSCVAQISRQRALHGVVSRSSTNNSPGQGLTGERTLPGIWHENYWYRRHEAAYQCFAGSCARARVLDAGCGEGYGAARLSDAGARLVVGVDLDRTTLRHVRATYPGVRPVYGNLVALPLRANSVDVVVSAQTIEHLWDQAAFVRECQRVLRPGGQLLMSTPNSATFPPGNPFHSRELDAGELRALVAERLDVDQLIGVHHGARLAPYAELVTRQLAAPHADWEQDLVSLVTSVVADDFVVTADDVAASLDLIVMATSR